MSGAQHPQNGPFASIIITSYNYGRFLRECIDSALAQTCKAVEVIVVDDGSTDGSQDIIASYGTRIQAILKGNGGQASAFNVGFSRSRGGMVCFMDSDDRLAPVAMERVRQLCQDRSWVKVHWPLTIINEDGIDRGMMHANDLAEGDLRSVVARLGPAGYNWPSTSGNIWSRAFLEAIFPMPEQVYHIAPDVYLSALAPLFGPIAKTDEPMGCYRIHGQNNTCRKAVGERIREILPIWEFTFGVLEQHCRRLDLVPSPETWREHSWWHQFSIAIEELLQIIPEHTPFVLVDDGQWAIGADLTGRPVFPLLEKNGRYWGPPQDDDVAMKELERMQQLGAGFVVFASASFWWLEHYARFREHLRTHFTCRLQNPRLLIFDLRQPMVHQ